MTQEMIDLQNRAVNELFELTKADKKEITFKAPTGSGKTYMMSHLMNLVLENEPNSVFLVSTLSKSGLAEQNFKSFDKFGREKFTHLKPFLIESGEDGEGAIFIPHDKNVYVLGRDLYKDNSRIKSQGALVKLLGKFQGLFSEQNKKIYLIKDECHQATNNLDDLDKEKKYFSKVINISATPSEKKNQIADVEIYEAEAVGANLIKEVQWCEDESVDIKAVLDKFVEVKKSYLADAKNGGVGVNPCLIVQISNKDKADEEIKQIKALLSQKPEIQYMIIMDESKSSKCDTNNIIGAKKMPIKKWKEEAKLALSPIDVIIFKMVISEGWDIPRACMLYQVRDSKSKQLDEQVIGRVRRNPRLMDFEKLNPAQKETIKNAYIYGVKPEKINSGTTKVSLKGEINKGLFNNQIAQEFKITITRIDKSKVEKEKFNAENLLNSRHLNETKEDIFTLFQNLNKNAELAKICAEFAGNDVQKWYKFANNAKMLQKEFEKIVTNYDESVTTKGEDKQELEGTLALESFFVKSQKMGSFREWIWDLEKIDKYDDSKKFAFDSAAELEFAWVIKEILKESVQRLNFDGTDIYLFGKNYPHNSEIKFEYYLDGYHFSYPDFILKDKKGRFHIFEVKSLEGLNSSDFTGAKLDKISDEQIARLGEYERKIVELYRIYGAISKKVPYHFWLPIKQKGGKWLLVCFYNDEKSSQKGEAKNLFNDQLFTENELKNALEKRLSQEN